MTDPAGPIWSGGFEETVVSEAGVDYTLQFLPDKHNDLLQQEGKPPVYYWLMNGVRLARKQNADYTVLWQYCGDNTSALPGYPHTVAGFNKIDISVYVKGAQKPTLEMMRTSLLR